MSRTMPENAKLYRARITRLIPAREAGSDRWSTWLASDASETVQFVGPYLPGPGAALALGRARTQTWGPKMIEEKSYVEVLDPTDGQGWVKKPCVCR